MSDRLLTHVGHEGSMNHIARYHDGLRSDRKVTRMAQPQHRGIGTAGHTRRAFLTRAAVFTAVASAPNLLAACSSGGSSGAAKKLAFLVSEPFGADWNPYGHSLVISYKVNKNVFDRLVEFEPDLSLRPGLAETWRHVDPLTWEFRLKDGVRFHDGQAFGAADVKASIELASGTVDPEIMSASNWVPFEVEEVDELTVRLRSKEEFGPLLNLLAITDIVCAADASRGAAALAKKPNGTGPFKVTVDEANRKTFAAHDGHHGGKPSLEEMTWEYIQDGQTRVNALLGGQTQIIDRVEVDQFSLFAGNDAVQLASRTSTETQFLEMRTDRPPFNSHSLRQAVAWAVDRAQIRDLVGGEAQLATSFWAPTVAYHQQQEPAYSRDVAKAQELFAQGGGKDVGEVELVVSTGFFPKSSDIGELIRQSLEEVGFRVKLTVVELGAWLDILLGEEKRGHLFHGGWTTMFPDPDRAMRTLYHSQLSATGWVDPTTDELLGDARATTDETRRAELYATLQQHMWSQVPHVPLIHSDLSDGRVTALSGVEALPNFLHKFADASFATG